MEEQQVKPELIGTSHNFIAIVEKLHTKKSTGERFYFATNIVFEETGEEFRDHCWLPFTMRLNAVLLNTKSGLMKRPNIKIKFNARIEKYPNRYDEYKMNLKHIRYVREIKIIER
jgi:hypothetical protein